MNDNINNQEQQPVEQTHQAQVPNTMAQALPNATGILVMGIISIATCWCYGIAGLALGIISIVLSNKAKRLYEETPNAYTESSYKNMKAGRTCAIVGTCLSGAYLVFIIIYLLVIGAAIGTAFSTMPWDTSYY